MSKPYKTILCVDFETRWDSSDYTLSKMTTEEYIRDPRFKAFGVCIHEVGSSAPVQWYSHAELPRIFGMYDWSTTAVLAHNAQFDVSIMSFIYGVKPCFIFDTLSMGRALRGVEVGNSLMKLAEDFGLPAKGKALYNTNGLTELTPEMERELAAYCKHDVYLCEEIFARFMMRLEPDGTTHGAYPTKELRLIDMTLKMYIDPKLELDGGMLLHALNEEKGKLETALLRADVEEAALASNEQFAEVLRKLGVEPPTKTSKTTGKEAFAFAKNDALFQSLLNGDDEDVALLCEARLRVKSTLERTRAQRFIDIASRGALPVPLSYYGASVTGRWAAAKGSNINLQNMKRGSFLRKSIMAPIDYLLCVGDLSQIEPRVLAWLADYNDLLDIFRAGGDPYADFGGPMFNVPGMTKESHPLLRQSSKSAMLGAGYQLGWASFAGQLLVGFLGAPPVRYSKAQAKQLGVTQADFKRFMDWPENLKKMAEIPHSCTEEELAVHCLAAKAIIEKYRAAAAPVVDFWGLLGNLIEHSLVGGKEYTHKGVLHFSKERIEMANGMHIRYPDLKQHVDEKDPKRGVIYTYTDGKKRVKLYPGKVCNNCIGENTLVLTDRGWVSIENVNAMDMVHDGDTFVQHAGLISKGVQGCVTIDGVDMTPDHEVLADDGWQKASQFPRPYRPDLWHVAGAFSGGERAGRLALAVSVRLRAAVREVWRGCFQGIAPGWVPELRVRNAGAYQSRESQTRNGAYPAVDCMGEHARTLSEPRSSRVQKLRRSWDNRVRTLGQLFREFFSGYGGHIPVGVGAGAQGQQQGVFPRQLRVGDTHNKRDESTDHAAGSGRTAVKRADRYRQDNDIQPHTRRMAGGEAGDTPGIFKQVFDIMDCGPQNRFVVKGVAGPFIVHNCTQGTARIVMSDGLLRVQDKYPVLGTVHDEGIVLVPESDAGTALPWVLGQMTKEPKWMPGIPLAADGGIHKRYGMAKN